jgi:hypothetical protein
MGNVARGGNALVTGVMMSSPARGARISEA